MRECDRVKHASVSRHGSALRAAAYNPVALILIDDHGETSHGVGLSLRRDHTVPTKLDAGDPGALVTVVDDAKAAAVTGHVVLIITFLSSIEDAIATLIKLALRLLSRDRCASVMSLQIASRTTSISTYIVPIVALFPVAELELAITAAYEADVGPSLDLHPPEIYQDRLQVIKVGRRRVGRFEAWVHSEGVEPLELNGVVEVVPVFGNRVVDHFGKDSCQTVDDRGLRAFDGVDGPMHVIVSAGLIELPKVVR